VLQYVFCFILLEILVAVWLSW